MSRTSLCHICNQDDQHGTDAPHACHSAEKSIRTTGEFKCGGNVPHHLNLTKEVTVSSLKKHHTHTSSLNSTSVGLQI